MSEEREVDHDHEERFLNVLRCVEPDAAPVNQEALDALLERSLAAFLGEGAEGAQPDESVTPAVSHPASRSRATALALKSLATAAGLAIAIVIWSNVAGPVRGASFSEVVAALRNAKTLELRLTKGPHAAQVWVRTPGQVRVEESPQRYQISVGSHLWRIDEGSNTVTEGNSPWFVDPQQQIDLVGLLDVGITDSTDLWNAQATGREQYAGRACDVYRVDLPGRPNKVLVEAFVDSQNQALLAIVARMPGREHAAPPLAELQLVAMNPAVEESKFVVAKSLTEDGRIGKISEAQGVALLRPVGSERWTPLCGETLLKPGDWLRTDLRGANALRMRLSSEVELTLGPGALLECISPTQARLYSGEVQAQIPKGAKNMPVPEFTLLAPRNGSRKLSTPGKVIFRVDRAEQLTAVTQRPQWLAGFEGTSNNESLGSLIVNLPDGRNEPLTVGYHKVNVEIRDQIARTTIEESFVNHTGGRLEGIFYFPLPQDASISGFGMWIGNDLVEADIVEKQRAREIYETILRERRDPGLLEWTVGNLFRARVFPIDANSEKRIKIVYTQVLPLSAGRYRYAYGLRSELLRTHPLRDLSLTVTVNSALPIKSVTCPTHAARVQSTPHSAQVDFSAQEYTPSRDFEAVVEIDSRQSNVVVVPHRRGEDGYLLMQLTPPAPEGNWQRQTLRDGEPVHIVLLCDTSASMDSEKRKEQAEFVATVLATLGDKDRFLLAATDVATTWASEQPLPPTAKNLAMVHAFLDDRISLGWTNLDQAFEAVLKKAPPKAQVIYVGDGIPTAGQRDPAAVAQRLERLVAERGPKDAGLTFHAVTVGNTSERTVLNAIAGIGGGSVRAIGGQQTPQTVALDLLHEIVAPGLRDVRVEFRGIKVAAVYPERLPNVAAGMQQILVGRYLPKGKDQQGEVIVSGTLGTQTVRYAAKINFADAEAGNSFIPRLWARAHLDHLLQQGQAQSVRDEIIALSEQFHIITPYTSLLVLETDADRERFGVKRRYEMRDGERFFQKGRDNATYELAQQQMKRAADWRLGLRRQSLRQLATLGRQANFGQRAYQQVSAPLGYMGGWGGAVNTGGTWSTSDANWNFSSMRHSGASDWSEGDDAVFSTGSNAAGACFLTKVGSGTVTLSGANTYSGATTVSGGTLMLGIGDVGWDGKGNFSGAGTVVNGSGTLDLSGFSESINGRSGIVADGDGKSYLGDFDDAIVMSVSAESWDFESPAPLGPAIGAPFRNLNDKSEMYAFESDNFESHEASESQFGREGGRSLMGLPDVQLWNGQAQSGSVLSTEPDSALAAFNVQVFNPFPYDRATTFDGGRLNIDNSRSMSLYDVPRQPMPSGGFEPGYYGVNQLMLQPEYSYWLSTLFPNLAGPPAKASKVVRAPAEWSPEALALAKSLLRTDSLAKLQGGIELRREISSFDPRWNRRSGHASELVLYGPSAWLARPLDVNGQKFLNYCNGTERGVFSPALLLGRVRKSVPRDLSRLPLAIVDSSLTLLSEAYREYPARVEKAGEHQAVLILSVPETVVVLRYTIDTAKHAVVKLEITDDGKMTSTTTFADFVEVGGSWWARKVTITDAQREKTNEQILEIKALTNDRLNARIAGELALLPKVQTLRLPLPKLGEARQRVANGAATFDDCIVMLLHYAQLEKWSDALRQLDAAEKLSADKPGIRWLRTSLLGSMRRNEEARQRLLDEARQLAAHPQADEGAAADFILSLAQGVSTDQELLDCLKLLSAATERQPAEAGSTIRLTDRLAGVYENLGRNEDAMPLRRKLAAQMPWDANRQAVYAQRLMRAGQEKAAYAWLEEQLARQEHSDASRDVLNDARVNLYRSEGRWADLLGMTTAWIKSNPTTTLAYQQHLSALVLNDRLEDANALASQWLKQGEIDGVLTADALARLTAAISFAQGNLANMNIQRMEERWHEPLAAAARFFILHKHHWDITQQIVAYRFADTDACDRLRGYFLMLLQGDLEKFTPGQIRFLVENTLNGRIELAKPLNGRNQLDAAEIPDAIWQKIATNVQARWAEANQQSEKMSLGDTLRIIDANRFSDSKLLPLLRDQVAAAPDLRKTYFQGNLFDTLLSQKWTEANEKEAFQMLRQLSNAEDPSAASYVQVAVLHRLVNAMLAGRIAEAQRAMNDKGHLDELTRPQLVKKLSATVAAARKGLAAQLAAEAKSVPAPLVRWLRIEQSWLDVQSDQNLDQAAELCWQILGSTPVRHEDIDDTDLSTRRQQWLDAALRQRALVTVMNLAARHSAKPKAVERVLHYVDAGIAQRGDGAAAWRGAMYQLLIALDRPDELEQRLREWIRTDVTTAPWRKSLAMLLAERGKLAEAIQLFEAAQQDDLSTAADYRTLALWYQAMDRKDEYQRARRDAFRNMSEQQLNQVIYVAGVQWGRTDRPLPSRLDENVLDAYRTLFEKSPRPEAYLYRLHELYAACRDFRLLQILPDAVLGRSPQQVYPFLQTMRGAILQEVRNEASADEIVARIKTLRDATRSVTDLRALDLLEAMVERRSAEVQDQRGPHVAACLLAMQRAFHRKWSAGEPRLMATLLQQLGTLPDAKMIEEQLHELRALLELVPAQSQDHLAIACSLAQLQFSNYSQQQQALQFLEAEIRGYDLAHHGTWPQQDNEFLGIYVNLLSNANHDAAAEVVLKKYLAGPANNDQRDFLEESLRSVYNHALESDGAVSLGSQDALFANVIALCDKQLITTTDENVRRNIIVRMVAAMDIAHRKKMAGANEQMLRLAFKTMPVVLKQQGQRYRDTVTLPLSSLEELLGPKDALRYIVQRMQQYPARLDFTWEDSWSVLGNALAWQVATKKNLELGDLEPQILDLVIAELKRSLRTGNGRNSYICWHNYSYFWTEKAGNFAQAAEEVYQERKTSGRRIVDIARYLRDGLNLHPRSVEILLIAHHDGLLTQADQQSLAEFLQQDERFAESIPISEPLVAASPDLMNLRVLLMRAYFHADRRQQLLDLVKQTDAHFHSGGRWVEANISAVAMACVECHLFHQAIGYLKEAIAVHQHTYAGSEGDQALSALYDNLAQAYSGLDQTKEAVDAASAAIVCWSPRYSHRQDALQRLQSVLAEAKALKLYVKDLDKQSAKTGQDSPILRKALGRVYQDRSQFPLAIAQYQLALQLQPNDKDVNQGLIACYDQTKQPQLATRQLLAWIDFDRHDLTLYQQLAERLKNDEAQAERAATSIIEAGPNEAENHAAMAELRQKQGRWQEAIVHWNEVASLRRLEPTGLVKLAAAQAHEKQWTAARDTIAKIRKAEWPSRFNNLDADVRSIEESIPK